MNLYRNLLIAGFFIWLLTLGAIAGLVAGVIQGTKEMHVMNNKLVTLDGSVMQCASSDFAPNKDGKLVSRTGSAAAGNLSIEVSRAEEILTL